MSADSFFTQGSSHRICQDYATHGDDFAIVSDGCSSAPFSDFGARLLTQAAIQVMQQGTELGSNAFYQRVLGMALGYCQSMNLPVDCLFATLMIAKKIDTQIVVTMRGDGVIAAKQNNGSIYYCYLEFPKTSAGSTPFFLRYDLDTESLNAYRDNVGNKYKIIESVFNPATDVFTHSETELEIDFSTSNLLRMTFETSEVSSVAIMSDGALAFMAENNTLTQKQTQRVPERKIVAEMMDFKGYTGEFAQRRCKMAFRKFDKANWKPFDDFAIGVVSI
jgi:hypothetical protein